MARRDDLIRYVRTNLEEALVIAAMGRIAFSGVGDLTDTEQAVLAALRRSNSALADASPEDIASYLRGLDDDALTGVVANTKGILHEMQFVEMENGDGDSIYASIFPETNHPGTDVRFIDVATGDTWEVQLKATDSEDYADQWLDEHPEGDILVTSELANRTGLPSSGLANADLTDDVEGTVDRVIADDPGIWDYFPIISALTLSNLIWALWQRYQGGEIDWERFKVLAVRASGLKVAKIAALSVLLSIPVLGTAAGALLIARFLVGAKNAWDQCASEPAGADPPRLPGTPA